MGKSDLSKWAKPGFFHVNVYGSPFIDRHIKNAVNVRFTLVGCLNHPCRALTFTTAFSRAAEFATSAIQYSKNGGCRMRVPCSIASRSRPQGCAAPGPKP